MKNAELKRLLKTSGKIYKEVSNDYLILSLLLEYKYKEKLDDALGLATAEELLDSYNIENKHLFLNQARKVKQIFFLHMKKNDDYALLSCNCLSSYITAIDSFKLKKILCKSSLKNETLCVEIIKNLDNYNFTDITMLEKIKKDERHTKEFINFIDNLLSFKKNGSCFSWPVVDEFDQSNKVHGIKWS